MKKVIIILMTFFFALIVVIGILFGVNYMSGDAVLNSGNSTNNTNVNANGDSNDSVTGGEVVENALSCFDLIDKQLAADGFTYLQDAMWGRGVNNSFIYDVVKQEFYRIDYLNPEMYPAEWYAVDFNKYVMLTYNYSDNKIWNSAYLANGGSKDSSVAQAHFDPEDVLDDNYEFPYWMAYYNDVATKYGCSLTDLTVDKLVGEYKTIKSTALETDIISVFDRKSEDGVIRYFADVHVEGDVEDNPRYKELQSKEEYYALDNAENFEQVYFVNVLYKDSTTKPLMADLMNVQSSIIKEFTKDVVFANTTWIEDEPKNDTLGVYFIYIDNPNGNFEYMSNVPKRTNGRVDYSLSKFESIRTPFDGFVMLVNKSQVKLDQVYELEPQKKIGTLNFYLQIIKDTNPDFKYSEDFVTNYSRPFNKDWQKRMGLVELFDAKYGFINNDIEYVYGH